MFRKLARETQPFVVSWPSGMTASPVAESDAQDIGAFLLRVGHPLRPECEAGTLAGAAHYVTRLFDYHRGDTNFAMALECSTVVREELTGRVAAVCLVGGGGPDGREFGIYDIVVDPALRRRGIGTSMIRRAMAVLHRHGIETFHLWREDDSPAASLYDRLGFVPTGEVE